MEAKDRLNKTRTNRKAQGLKRVELWAYPSDETELKRQAERLRKRTERKKNQASE